jgi:hypothetical protein
MQMICGHLRALFHRTTQTGHAQSRAVLHAHRLEWTCSPQGDNPRARLKHLLLHRPRRVEDRRVSAVHVNVHVDAAISQSRRLTHLELSLLRFGRAEKLPISGRGLPSAATAPYAGAVPQLPGAQLCQLCASAQNETGVESTPCRNHPAQTWRHLDVKAAGSLLLRQFPSGGNPF